MEKMNLKEHLRSEEIKYIMAALEATGHCKYRASILLSMNRTTLVEKLRRLGLHHLINYNPTKKAFYEATSQQVPKPMYEAIAEKAVSPAMPQASNNGQM